MIRGGLTERPDTAALALFRLRVLQRILKTELERQAAMDLDDYAGTCPVLDA